MLLLAPVVLAVWLPELKDMGHVFHASKLATFLTTKLMATLLQRLNRFPRQGPLDDVLTLTTVGLFGVFCVLCAQALHCLCDSVQILFQDCANGSKVRTAQGPEAVPSRKIVSK